MTADGYLSIVEVGTEEQRSILQTPCSEQDDHGTSQARRTADDGRWRTLRTSSSSSRNNVASRHSLIISRSELGKKEQERQGVPQVAADGYLTIVEVGTEEQRSIS